MVTKWDDYKAEFDWDGSWRDIYVLDTSIADWQALLDAVNAGIYPHVYFADGEVSVLPTSAAPLFDYSVSRYIALTVGAIGLNCHFFSDEVIECDIDPREVKSQTEAEQIFDFMMYLGRLLDKEVVLTPENDENAPIFRLLPGDDEVQYIPSQPST